jgi:hypothetical protein
MAGKGQGEHSAENGKLGGRPVSTPTLVAQEFRRHLAAKIKADMQSWIEPIEDLAKGHFVQVKTKEGELKVYRKSPDARAWEKVMDRAFGKAPQPLTGDPNGVPLSGILVQFVKTNDGEKSNQD